MGLVVNLNDLGQPFQDALRQRMSGEIGEALTANYVLELLLQSKHAEVVELQAELARREDVNTELLRAVGELKATVEDQRLQLGGREKMRTRGSRVATRLAPADEQVSDTEEE